MTALAKYKLQSWPYSGPIALVERDEFGMHEDFHIFDSWHYLGTTHSEDALNSLLENRDTYASEKFDADIYRLINKTLNAGKMKVIFPFSPV